MKKLAVLFLICVFAMRGISQGTEKFVGKYLVNGIGIVIDGPGVGYTNPIEPNTLNITTYGNQLILKYFGSEDSIFANVKLDSFFIFRQFFRSGECSSAVYGKGKLLNDSLFYQYILGGTCQEDVLELDCVGIKDKENSISFIKNDVQVLTCFPNPTNSDVFIELDIPQKVYFATVQIYKGNGAFVKSIELGKRGQISQSISIDDLVNGLYYGIVLFDNQRKYYCKLIKTE